ncbi:MAG TPA: hypothetical protein VE028_04010 [Nitratidesulfovibrio sp.]|nr:hypothetical protein [Nitratidesulfovibrio sp.]
MTIAVVLAAIAALVYLALRKPPCYGVPMTTDNVAGQQPCAKCAHVAKCDEMAGRV